MFNVRPFRNATMNPPIQLMYGNTNGKKSDKRETSVAGVKGYIMKA
jgi:hypothetical protein